jgi:hypothetical protein
VAAELKIAAYDDLVCVLKQFNSYLGWQFEVLPCIDRVLGVSDATGLGLALKSLDVPARKRQNLLKVAPAASVQGLIFLLRVQQSVDPRIPAGNLWMSPHGRGRTC